MLRSRLDNHSLIPATVLISLALMTAGVLVAVLAFWE